MIIGCLTSVITSLCLPLQVAKICLELLNTYDVLSNPKFKSLKSMYCCRATLNKLKIFCWVFICIFLLKLYSPLPFCVYLLLVFPHEMSFQWLYSFETYIAVKLGLANSFAIFAGVLIKESNCDIFSWCVGRKQTGLFVALTVSIGESLLGYIWQMWNKFAGVLWKKEEASFGKLIGDKSRWSRYCMLTL